MGDDEAEGLRPWLLHPRRGQGSPLSLRVLTGGAGHRANTKGSTGQCPSELRSERRDGSAFAVGRRSTRSVGTPPEGGAPTGSELTVSRGGVRAGRHTAHRGCHRARPISWYVCWKPAGGPRQRLRAKGGLQRQGWFYQRSWRLERSACCLMVQEGLSDGCAQANNRPHSSGEGGLAKWNIAARRPAWSGSFNSSP